MSAQSRQFITLESIINDYLNESEQSAHKYAKLWHLAYVVMEELGIDFFYAIRSVKLPILGNKTVKLPNDCLRYTKIGVLNVRGEVVPLIFNNKLTLYADAMPNRQEKTIDNNGLLWNQCINGAPFYGYGYGVDGYNNGYTPIYGIPSGAPYQGGFNIDEANGIVLFDERFHWEYVIIEYVSSPQEGDPCSVPVHFRKAIMDYLWWRDNKVLSVKRGQVGTQAQLRHEYFESRRKANGTYRPWYLDQAYQTSLEATRMAVKS